MALSPAELAELHGLYARYAFAFDHGDAAGWAALFASDGRFCLPESPDVLGRAALEAFAVERNQTSPGMRHFTSNVLIEGSGPTTRGRASVVVYRVDGERLRLRTMGEYHDEFVKRDGRWLFAARRYEPCLPASLLDASIRFGDGGEA